MNERLSRLNEIIGQKCVLTSEKGWLVSPSGTDNGWLIDMRHALLDPEALEICANEFWDRCETLLPFQLGGLEISAIPIVTAFALVARQRGYNVNGFIIRKERKSYGVGKIVEGHITDEPIFAVDDIMNSAGTLEKVRATLDSFGRKIKHVFVVVNYKSAPGIDWCEQNEISPFYLYSLDDFGLKQGKKNQRILNRFENVWSFSSGKGNHFHVVPKSSPVLSQDKVMFGSDRGTFWALDLDSGAVNWRFEISDPGRKGIWSRPVVAGTTVFFGAYDGNVYALDIATGREVWRNVDADWIGSSPAVDVDLNLLWIGCEYRRPRSRGSIAALDLSTGKKRWEHFVSEFVHASPSFSSRYRAIAIGGNDRILYLLDAETGDIRWEFRADGEIKDTPCFDEERGLIYFTAFDGIIRAVDVDTGDLVWQFVTPNSLYSQPVLSEDSLVVSGMDKRLHIFDVRKNKYEAVSLGSKSVSTPTVIDHSVFLGNNGGAILEIDKRSNRTVGRHQLPDPVTTRIAYDPDRELFLASTYMNEMFAFRRTSSG